MSEIFSYSLLKSVHLIGIVAWFAGLFYYPRLLIYFVEAAKKPEAEKTALQTQFLVMMRRLWMGITVPAMGVTVAIGIWLLVDTALFKAGWMHSKLLLVFLLIGYHHYLGALGKKAAKGKALPSAYRLRLINEVATLFLVGIVAIVVFKSQFSWAIGGPVLGIIWILMWAVIKRQKK